MAEKNKAFLVFGIFGPLFFITSFTLQGFFRQNYSSLLYPISSLSLAENGWIQILTFILTGISFFIFALAMLNSTKYSILPVLFALIAIGLTASGFFSTDAVYGYPATEPFNMVQYTTHGKLHVAVSLFVFIGLPAACFITGWHFYKNGNNVFAFYSVASGIAMAIFFFLSGAGFNQQLGLKNIAGLLQRLCVCTGFIWVSVYARFIFAKK
jgi:hypothetical membrane protein